MTNNKKIDWNSDDIFVIRYQALSYAQGQMTGENFERAENWLKENEDRYVRLISKKKDNEDSNFVVTQNH